MYFLECDYCVFFRVCYRAMCYVPVSPPCMWRPGGRAEINLPNAAVKVLSFAFGKDKWDICWLILPDLLYFLYLSLEGGSKDKKGSRISASCERGIKPLILESLSDMKYKHYQQEVKLVSSTSSNRRGVAEPETGITEIATRVTEIATRVTEIVTSVFSIDCGCRISNSIDCFTALCSAVPRNHQTEVHELNNWQLQNHCNYINSTVV